MLLNKRKKWLSFIIVTLMLFCALKVQSQTGCAICKRPDGKVNDWANVDTLNLSKEKVFIPCPPGLKPRSGSCGDDDMKIGVSTKATDKENDVLTYSYTVSGGRIIGSGANVSWDLSGVRPGTYTITVAVDDGCGFCGKTMTKTVTVAQCDCEAACAMPTVSVTGPSGLVKQGELAVITANAIGVDNLIYNWILPPGVKFSGQGSPSIIVDTTELAGQDIMAEVEITGGCEPIRNSHTFSVQKNPQSSYRPNLGVCEKFTPANLQNYDYLEGFQKILIAELEIAGNHYQEGNYDAALAKLNWILEENKNNSEDLNPCALSLLGAIYSNTGNYQKAIGYYEKIIPLSSKSKKRLWEATALTNIGLVYLELKKYAKAIQYFKIGIPIYTQLKDDFGLASTLNYYGAALRGMKFYQQAVATHTKALNLAKSIDSIEDKSLIGDIFEELGRDALAQNQIKKAIQIFKQSLVYFNEINDSYGKTETSLDLLNALKRDNQLREAIFYGKQGVNLLQKVRQNIKSLSQKEQDKFLKSKEKHYRRLAEILITEGRFWEAQAVLALLKEDEYFGYVRRDEDEIKKLAQKLDPNSKERAALEKYEQLAGKVTEFGTQFVKLEELKNKQSADFKQQAEYDDLKLKLDAANAAFRIFLEKELAAEFGKSVKKEIELDRALQAKLQQWGNGTVALYTIAGEDRYRVILTTPKTQIDGKYEIKAAELNKKIFDFRAALQNSAIDPRPLGKELYDILIKPIEKDLEAAEAKTLLWSLDGTLRYIPLAALSPDGKTYLAEKYQTVVVTSTIRQKLVEEVNPNWQILGAGVTKESKVIEPNGTDEIKFNPLPGVESELLKIVRNEGATTAETGVMTGKRIMDEGFSLTSLEEGMSQRPNNKPKYNVIHLATHFRLGSNSANSFLLLGGNQALTLEKVSDNTLLNFGEVELVTLSACNTGFGTATENKALNQAQERKMLEQNNGVEVDSLATFIELRGAKSVLATLWSVADESTSLLMSEFYRIKKENPNLSKSEAMQLAQQAMISGKLKSGGNSSGCRNSEVLNLDGSSQTKFKCDANAPFSHPFYWSPFILIGNWR